MGIPRKPNRPAWANTFGSTIVTKPSKPKKNDPYSLEYTARTIQRLEIFTDRMLPTDRDVWEVLAEHWNDLLPIQAKALREYLMIRLFNGG